MKLRIATRRSALALTQTRWVAAKLREYAPDLEVEEVHVVTEGDRILDKPLMNVGGKGLFVSEVEATLVDGRADIAVHSLKDVPTGLADGLGILCIPPREDPADVLISREGLELEALPAGARVGTSSLRRACQLGVRRPDLAYATLRGNVDTRLRKLDEGDYDAIVLALSGLRRLGLAERPLWKVPLDQCIPAIGQGALAVEARLDDGAVHGLLARLEDEHSRLAIEAERAFLIRLSGSCKTPIAGHAHLEAGGTRLMFDGMVGSVDGQQMLSGGGSVVLPGHGRGARLAAAQALGKEIAEDLVARGAERLIGEAVAAAERAARTSN